MVEPCSLNAFKCLWKQLTISQIVMQRPKYIKLAKIVVVQVLMLWKMNNVLVHWVLWKTNLGIGWQHIWMLSFRCLFKGFILLKVFLIIELLKSGRLPIVAMQLMLNCFDIGKTHLILQLCQWVCCHFFLCFFCLSFVANFWGFHFNFEILLGLVLSLWRLLSLWSWSLCL